MKAAYVLIHGHQFLDGFRFDSMDIPDRHLKRIGNLILGHPLKVKQFDNLTDLDFLKNQSVKP